MYFFDSELIEKIVEKTHHLFSIQQNVNNNFRMTKDGLKNFLGIVIMMSIINLPNSRSFWNSIIGNTTIQETISVKRSKNVQRYLQFNNN